MSQSPSPAFPTEGDALRLLALGRVPRCGRCSRYRTLLDARSSSPWLLEALPPVPSFCSYQVCAPLAARYRATLSTATTVKRDDDRPIAPGQEPGRVGP